MPSNTDKMLSIDNDDVEFAFTVATIDAIDAAMLEFEFRGFVVETLTAIEVLKDLIEDSTIH